VPVGPVEVQAQQIEVISAAGVDLQEPVVVVLGGEDTPRTLDLPRTLSDVVTTMTATL
jgi:hypothetical protein